jgi:ribosomal protein S18 acetylase RimI-like enzyme
MAAAAEEKGTTMDIRPYQSRNEAAVVALWTECGLTRPWNDPHEDIRRKLQVQPELFLVGIEAGRVIATVMAGYDGHRGWINYLAVTPQHRRKGLGRRMMEEAQRCLAKLGCSKINLQVRASNSAVIEFYQRLGFTVDDVISLGKRLVPEQGSGRQGT